MDCTFELVEKMNQLSSLMTKEDSWEQTASFKYFRCTSLHRVNKFLQIIKSIKYKNLF